jgi:hypothetical protein
VALGLLDNLRLANAGYKMTSKSIEMRSTPIHKSLRSIPMSRPFSRLFSRPFARIANKSIVLHIALAIVLMPLATLAQTQIKIHGNKFKPQEDVRLGRQAAAEAEQQFPLLRDGEGRTQ